MPSKKTTKRAREAVDAVEAQVPEKKAKQNEEFKPVIEAIQAAELSDSCRAMLLSFVPACLDTPRESRDSLQNLAVDLLSKFFDSRRAEMKKAIEEESEKLVAWETGAGELDAKVAKAQQELTEVGEAKHEEKKKELATASQAMVASKAAASDAKEAQKSGDATYEDAVAEKKAVEAIVTTNLPSLKEGQWAADTAQGQIDGIMPLAKKLKLDASLVSAMPSSLIKAPADRGPFDQMVIQQLEEVLQAKSISLAEQIEAEGPAVKERAAAVEQAQKAADEAKLRQQQAASAVFEAQAVVKDLQTALGEAKAEKESYGPKFKAATQVRDSKTKELEVFETVSLVCFEKLRERAAEPAMEPEKAASEPATTPSKVVELATPGVQVAVGGQ